MSRLLVVIIAVAFFTFNNANAQDVKFGVKAGLNLANFSTSESEISDELKPLTGLHLGGFVELGLSDQFAIQPELLFSMQGAKADYEEEGYSETGKTKLSYLSIPVLAKIYFTPELYLEVGPQLGFLLSAKSIYEISFQGVEETEEEVIDEGLESIDFGLGFGGGYFFTDNLFLGARYNLGLTNIDAETDEITVKNSVINVSLGYRF